MLNKIKTQFLFYFFAIMFGAAVAYLINNWFYSNDVIDFLQAKDKNVLENVEIMEHKIDKSKNTMYVHLTGEKVRDDCGAPISISGFYGQPLVAFDTVNIVRDITNPEASLKEEKPFIERPAIPGKVQDFKWWAAVPIPVGDFYIYIEYLCGQHIQGMDPYIKKNISGPFRIDN